MIVTKEIIKEEIEKVSDEDLETLYKYVKHLAEIKPKKQSKESFMAKMRKIKINAPSDFAANIDEYLYGGKDFGENLHWYIFHLAIVNEKDKLQQKAKE